MSIFYLPEGNIVTVVTLDTDTTSNEFYGAYRTLNLAIAGIKQCMSCLNAESEEDDDDKQQCWELIDAVHGTYQVWKCKNSNQTKTFNFFRYGL